ncbi:MAG: hypothetical protein AAFO75_08245 [Pseudomonadota bacterium]
MSETKSEDMDITHNDVAIAMGVIFALLGAFVGLVDGYNAAGILGALFGAPLGAIVFGIAGYIASWLRSLMRGIFGPVMVITFIGIVIYAVILILAETFGFL